MHPRSPSLFALAERWSGAPAGERANAQLYLAELADALGVERPRPAGSGFEFELPVTVTGRDGRETTNFVDLFRQRHFLLEAKHTAGEGSDEARLRRAYGQALSYVAHVPGGPPPFVLVLDVGRTLLAWDRWNGTYGGFQLARRIDLRSLADRDDDIEFLRAVWEDPHSLDPFRRAAAVTRDVAERLARLANALEDRGLEPERVARFLIRCVFTMFAEDVGLLQGEPFRRAIERYGGEPDEFAGAMGELWRAMDTGGRFGMDRLLRFNGHFFADPEVLPLSRAELATLLDAARADWENVEPTIFGTLLTRALDPVERHRLGAEYTPREYVERVVRQAVHEPIRERWTPVLSEVLQLKESRKRKDRDAALRKLREFHGWLRGLRFLDPACGSGNFLYVTLHTVKRLELEVLREIAELTGNPEFGAGRGGGAAVPRHRGEAVGARDRRAYAVDRLPPVLEGAPPGREPARAGAGGHRHAAAARRRACVGRDRRGAGEVPPRPHAAHQAPRHRQAGARSRCAPAVLRVPRRATGRVAPGGFHHRQSAVYGAGAPA